MTENNVRNQARSLLDFLRRAESLKSTLRRSWTRTGRRESTAEHSWRLSLFALLAVRNYPDLDALKVLQLCILHDLGEAVHGDIPAPEQRGPKDLQEREDMVDLLRPLPDEVRRDMLSLWEEYEYAETPEARLVKALDKLETLLQHTQGSSPPDGIDHEFNLGYGARYTGLDEFIRELRESVDFETESCLQALQVGAPADEARKVLPEKSGGDTGSTGLDKTGFAPGS